jgi:hypothetical protein
VCHCLVSHHPVRGCDASLAGVVHAFSQDNPAILRVLRGLVLNGCCILPNAFSASIEMIVWFGFFGLLVLGITLIDFQRVRQAGIASVTLTCS